MAWFMKQKELDRMVEDFELLQKERDALADEYAAVRRTLIHSQKVLEGLLERVGGALDHKEYEKV